MGKKMKITRTLVALSLFATSCFAADPLPRAKPESVGMSSARLARIGAALKADVDKGRTPGAVIGVARKGKLVYFEAVGFRDKDAGAPMTTDAIFSIASMTKPMVSVALLQLYEEGKVLLSDPVGKYLPQLADRRVAASLDNPAETVPAVRQPTLQDILRHTAGLLYGGRGTSALHKMYPASSSSSGRGMTGEEFLAKLGTLPLAYQPGTVWDYSLAVDVNGLVVEKLSGKTLGEYLRERVWTPLGMGDTGFRVPPDKAGRYAKALASDPDTGKPPVVLDLTQPLKFECGGGCAASTAGDYLRFAQMLANKGRLGKAQILGRKTVEFMTTDHLGAEVRNGIPQVDPARVGYGFGLGVAVRRQDGISPINGSAGDYSWGGAYGTFFWVDPKQELVVVYMAHTPGPVRQHYRALLGALVYQAIDR
jgi:CubicO group peptidase (beta-lactamase class C family)